MTTSLKPTKQELLTWLIETIRHSYHIEYYLYKLNIDNPDDNERPHDLVGPGNKFEWDVASLFAIQYRSSEANYFQNNIYPALKRHRLQYHHRKWNDPNPKNPNIHSEDASELDMRIGAIDSLCSLREKRIYQGGKHSWSQVESICYKNPPHKIPYLLKMLPLMRQIPEPNIEIIDDLNDVPNIDIPTLIHKTIQNRIFEMKLDFKKYGYTF